MIRALKLRQLSVVGLMALAFSAGADEDYGKLKVPIEQLSLEDLMQMEVTTVAKKPQALSTVAAAISVITAEDIAHSGAAELPEILSMVPGVEVTRISSNGWAVSIRGFADRLSNKLLVLVDGRNAYDPTYSGVPWDGLHFTIEDIERIEVIRGPGGAVWGTNAVNGVINIITKSAAATQGGVVVAGVGDSTFGRARWGGSARDGSVFYRAYVSSKDADAQDSLTGGSGHDSYSIRSAGFRVDGYLADGAKWDASGDLHETDSRMNYFIASTDSNVNGSEQAKGVVFRARYELPLANGDNLQLLGAFLHNKQGVYPIDSRLGSFLSVFERDTLDLEIQHRLHLSSVHDVVWGLYSRMHHDSINGGSVIDVAKAKDRLNVYSIYGQDEISLKKNLRLSLGVRLDHNDYMGCGVPSSSVRIAWGIQPNHTLWGAVSQTIREPSRFDRVFGAFMDWVPGQNGIPATRVYSRSNGDFGSEKLRAFDMGVRSQWAGGFSSDVVLFSHRYDDLRTATFVGQPDLSTAALGYVTTNIMPVNGGELILNGVELAADWRPSSSWRFQLAETLNDVSHINGTAVDASLIPRHITALHGFWKPHSDVSVDMEVRHTGSRDSAQEGAPKFSHPAYAMVNMRLAWRVAKGVELSLIGKNLNDGMCNAYKDATVQLMDKSSNVIQTCSPRSMFGQVRWDF